MTARAKTTEQDRLDRIERILTDIVVFISDNNPDRLTRSVAAPESGQRLLEFVRETRSQ